jgi:hypothetical protein
MARNGDARVTTIIRVGNISDKEEAILRIDSPNILVIATEFEPWSFLQIPATSSMSFK